MDNPCAKHINGELIQCYERSMNCAVNCEKWAIHKAQSQERYDNNALCALSAYDKNIKYIRSRVNKKRGRL